MKKLGSKKSAQQTSDLYCIEYLQKVTSKDIPLLPKTMRMLIKQAIEERLGVDPIGFGKPLQYNLKGCRRLRVGDYRIIYQIKEKKVIIIAIKHRKDVYENA